MGENFRLTQHYEKPASFMSEVYGECMVIRNDHGSFVEQYTMPTSFKTLPPNNPQSQLYLNATKKLFKQLQLSEQQLWICEKEGVTPIRVYFTEPKYYMISKCCRRCLYVQFEEDLSGSIVCSGCEKVCFWFVHVQNSDSKEPVSCERIFKKQRERNQIKKQKVRKLISSSKYRQKNLYNVLKTSPSNDIGEFIIEVRTQPLPFVCNFFSHQKQEIILTNTQQELKQIIEGIFS